MDVINCTGKGKYEALYLQTNILQKHNQFFRCLETTVNFWFILNFICIASRDNKRFELVFWRE